MEYCGSPTLNVVWGLGAIASVSLTARAIVSVEPDLRVHFGLFISGLTTIPGLCMIAIGLKRLFGDSATQFLTPYGGLILVALIGFPIWMAGACWGAYVCLRPTVRRELVAGPVSNGIFHLLTFAVAFLEMSWAV